MITQAVVPALELGFILVSAYIDYEHLIDNDFIESHRSRVIIRSIFGIALMMINIKFAVGYLLFHTALFSPVLNKMRGEKILHLGNTAAFDIYFGKRPKLYIATIITSLISAVVVNGIQINNNDVIKLIINIF